MTSIIVAGVVLAIIAGAGFCGYAAVKQKLTRFSRTVFGTDSITEGLERQAEELATTPKSVSGMTRIYEPQVQKDFPDFNLIQFKNKAENLLQSTLQAISKGSMELPDTVSQEWTRQMENQIADNRAQGITEIYGKIHIYQTEIANYTKQQGKCILTLQSAVGHLHYKQKDGAIITGDQQRLEQTKYNVELMYIQNERLASDGTTVGTNCPNCGAPITNLGAMYCEYCGLAVTPVNLKVWTFHRFYEVDYQHS